MSSFFVSIFNTYNLLTQCVVIIIKKTKKRVTGVDNYVDKFINPQHKECIGH